MSGSLDIHGSIQDWDGVKGYLFPEDVSTEEDNDNGGGVGDWDADWNWTEQEPGPSASPSKSVTSPKDKKVDVSWIQDCIIANSPMADFMAFARGQRILFLSSRWDVKSGEAKYSKCYQGCINEEDETITSVLCVPLVSKKKSSPGVPDWNCVIVGFSNGFVRMYTETGSLLISQLFHDQPVLGIKCRSYQPGAAATEHDQLEEVFFVYKTVIVTLDGFGLFQTLRACRNHLARCTLQANATESVIDAPPLSYKKWGYDQEESGGARDCDCIGIQTPSHFDHLFIASMMDGTAAKVSKVPFTSNVFIVAGNRPFLSVQFAQEGHAVPMIGEFAYAVASKLKSSIFNAASGWLGGFGGASPKVVANPKAEKPVIEPATKLGARFGLPDVNRKGLSVIVSPCRKLSVVTDTLGRVTLFDNDRGFVVRMWKGYREAHCSWLQIDDDMSSKSKASGRSALFLVIYAPRRGQLEVFSMQQGPKVASFPVSKNGKLLSTAYGMMGLNNIPIRGGNKPVLQCLFIDHEAQLFFVSVPFHLALCDSNNSKLKDLHLLKALQRLLRENKYAESDVFEILLDVKTQSMINQAFKILCQNCKSSSVLSAVVEGYLEKNCEDELKDLSVVFRIQSIIQLYQLLTKSTKSPPPYSAPEGAENSSHENTVLLCLHASKKEITLIKDIANKELFNKSPGKSVKFQEDDDFLTINKFLNSFEIEFDSSKLKTRTSFKLSLNRRSEDLPKLGKLLLCGCMNNNADLKEWKTLVKNCDLIPSELLLETLKFWCCNALMSSSYVDLMERLYHIVRVLCELEGFKIVMNTVSKASLWWDSIRKEIAGSSQIFFIYTFAIVCRAVSIDLQQNIQQDENAEEKKKGKSKEEQVTGDAMDLSQSDEQMDCDQSMKGANESSNDDDDDDTWESVSLDLVRWNILLKQIEDLSFLCTILNQRPQLSDPTLPVLESVPDELTVLKLLDKGKGCIAELVGKWLTNIGIDPPNLVDPSEIETVEINLRPEFTEKEMKARQKQMLHKDKNANTENPKMDVDIEEAEFEANSKLDHGINYTLELMRCLKDNFPVSLNSSIVLANYCWEYCLEWNKNVDSVEYLNAAIKCVCAVPSHFTRQGLMSMMWTTFISKQLSSLVSKSKVGKDKLSEKLSGVVHQDNKEDFLNACVKFLDEFMETNSLCQGIPPPESNNSKKNHWANDSSSSLTDLALLQVPANYEMILLHYQLSMTAVFIETFGIRKASMKALNLFDTKSRMMFFNVISNPAPYTNVEVDLALRVLREEFLCLVVTNAIHQIPEELQSTMENDDSDNSSYPLMIPSLEGLKACDDWLNKCFELGRTWGIELDGLRINQVCEYYSCGFDQLGLEMIGSVNSKDILGPRLLVVAGMRLHYIVQTNPEDTTEIVSSLSTNLSNWLNKLNYSKLRCLRFPRKSIADLAHQIIQLIPENNYDYKLADELLHCSNFLA